MGGVPREVVSTITPGVDITQFLLLNRQQVNETSTFNGVGGFTFANLVVPPGELWYVHWANASTSTLGAGEACRIEVAIEQLGIRLNVGDPMSAVAGERAVSFSRDFWLPAGGGILLRCSSFVAGGAINCSAGAIITRLRI